MLIPNLLLTFMLSVEVILTCNINSKYVTCSKRWVNKPEWKLLNECIYQIDNDMKIESVPTDIPTGSDMTNITIKGTSIRIIPSNAFIKQKTVINLNLTQNKIDTLEQDAFKDLSRLVVLVLSQNRISSLPTMIFQFNPRLLILDVAGNKLSFIPDRIFYWIHAKPCILPAHSYYKDNCRGVINWDLQTLNLQQNSFTLIKSDMFANLTLIRDLHWDWNLINDILEDAFIHVKFASITLNHNILTQISNKIFRNQNLLENLELSNNQIHEILFNSFLFLNNKLPEKSVNIDLSHNKLFKLSWMIFLDESKNFTCFNTIIARHRTIVNVTANNMSCSREQCWMHDINMNQGNNLHRSCSSTSRVLGVCAANIVHNCPDLELCVVNNDTECSAVCRNKGYSDGSLSIDQFVCPFKYFCTCSPCPVFNETLCENNCTETGKHMLIGKSHHTIGCKFCECQCEPINCLPVCKNHPFKVVNNTYDCPECQCECPEENCDAQCGRKELSIVKTDSFGCLVCDGCTDVIRKGSVENLIFILVVPSALASVVGLVVFLLIFFLRSRFKSKEHMDDPSKRNESVLNIFLCNVEPDLAHEIRMCWIDSDAFIAQQFLAKGSSGVVWSGRLQTGPYSAVSVAIKKVKDEYKISYTSTYREEGDEAQNVSELRSKEILGSKDAAEGFLREAMVMRKLNHPNVLSLFGVSVHDEKPCVILPLMSNGDLKIYLKTNSETLGVSDLLSFALGAAKGMAHIAELNFVHCNLAAKNCILKDNLLLKISSLESARESHVNYYQRLDKSKPDEKKEGVLIRWMSPESLEHNTFTFMSDVWSYGILLWEIFSFGKIPYESLEDTSILDHMKKGNRLERPIICPKFVYEIAIKCWRENSVTRPDFSVILDLLNRAADKEAAYLEVTR